MEASTLCRLCEDVPLVHEPDFGGADGICTHCREALGLVAMPPPRRPPRPCMRCNGMIFVRVMPRAVVGQLGDGPRSALAQPMTATFTPAVRDRLFLAGRVVVIGRGRGQLELYVCRGCGFAEWYCQDPESIPIGPEFLTDVVDYGSGSAYR